MKKQFMIQTMRDAMPTVSFLVRHNFPTHIAAVEAIKHAVRKWLLETEEGREAWRASSFDFNWGDVSLYDIPMPSDLRIENQGFDIVPVIHDEVLGE